MKNTVFHLPVVFDCSEAWTISRNTVPFGLMPCQTYLHILISMLYHLEKLSLKHCAQVTFSPALEEGKEPAALTVRRHWVAFFVVDFP